MPTDEQRMRERFEADCLHISEEQLARTEAGDYAIEWVHGTWIGYAIAYKARDAEVQALKKELGQLIDAIAVEKDTWTEADAENLQGRVQSARAALIAEHEQAVRQRSDLLHYLKLLVGEVEGREFDDDDLYATLLAVRGAIARIEGGGEQ